MREKRVRQLLNKAVGLLNEASTYLKGQNRLDMATKAWLERVTWFLENL